MRKNQMRYFIPIARPVPRGYADSDLINAWWVRDLNSAISFYLV